MLDLRIIVEQYPRSIATRSQLASLLHDLYPSEKRSVNVALAVYDSGIVSRIASLKTLDSIQQNNFIKLLVDEYGLQEKFAAEGIVIWAKAYGLSCKVSDNTIPAQSSSERRSIENHPDAYAKVGEVVTGLSSDYAILDTKEGVVITKFRGFDEAEIVIPNMINGKKVIGIGQNAFLGCASTKTLILSDGIKFIEDGAFADCKNVEKVVLPESLERIGSTKHSIQLYSSNQTYQRTKGVFEDSGITSIDLPNNLTYLGTSVFSGCRSLRFISLPSSIREIKAYTFRFCSHLTSVSLPDRLARIGDSAFSYCTELKNIKFPISLKEIGNEAFNSCDSLEVIILNEGLKRIGYKAFTNCKSLIRFLMPSTVQQIEETSDDFSSDIFTISTWYQPYDRRMKSYTIKSKNEKVTIYCYSGSYGLEYARKKGYPIKNAASFSA